MKDIYILGIETSCDDTSASIVKNGRTVVSNVVASQIDIHKLYGGVVPEVASRNHTENIAGVVDEALEVAKLSLEDIDAIAVTYGPGLEGALIVGVSYAKALAYANNIPLIGVHHIKGHIFANFLEDETLKPPFLSLIVSGGHTHLINVKDYNSFEILGKTRDDAAGEAYDKVARVMGLEYPGGPKIDKLSETGEDNLKFPRVWISDDTLDFSFSGLKSAVLNYINSCKMKEIDYKMEDVATSFQNAVVEVLVGKAEKAMKQNNIETLILGGGVACNNGLRSGVTKMCSENNFNLYLPNKKYCTDNAAMIASVGYYQYLDGQFSSLDLNAKSNLSIV